jgi:phage-related minor tail protein
MKHLKHASETLAETPENTLEIIAKHTQHLDKTIATYVSKHIQHTNKHTCNTRRKKMKH